MTLQEDVIVDIPKNRVKFFGTTGKMLLPCAATVADLIRTIPARKLITTDLLRKKLADQFLVEGTCPVTTRKALQEIANNADSTVAYWRVINKNGGLISQLPGGVEKQAACLQEEGFTIDAGGKAPKVKDFSSSLAH